MNNPFDIDPKILVRAKRMDNPELNISKYIMKRVTVMIPESVKLYNRYQNTEPFTVKQYMDNPHIQEEVDYIVSLIVITKEIIDSIFDIDAELKYVVKVTSPLFYKPKYNVELSIRVKHYKMVLHTIQTAHNLTDEKMIRTRKTLESLNVKIPKELSIAQYVRDNYTKNERRKALSDAIKDIFPQIDNKFIIDQITAKAL